MWGVTCGPARCLGYPLGHEWAPLLALQASSLAPAAYHPGTEEIPGWEVFHPESKLLGRPRGWGGGTGLGRATGHQPEPSRYPLCGHRQAHSQAA